MVEFFYNLLIMLGMVIVMLVTIVVGMGGGALLVRMLGGGEGPQLIGALAGCLLLFCIIAAALHTLLFRS